MVSPSKYPTDDGAPSVGVACEGSGEMRGVGGDHRWLRTLPLTRPLTQLAHTPTTATAPDELSVAIAGSCAPTHSTHPPTTATAPDELSVAIAGKHTRDRG